MEEDDNAFSLFGEYDNYASCVSEDDDVSGENDNNAFNVFEQFNNQISNPTAPLPISGQVSALKCCFGNS